MPSNSTNKARTRRIFSDEYKLAMVLEAEGCEYGQMTEMLQREGLFHNQISRWRQQCIEKGLLEAPKLDAVFRTNVMLDEKAIERANRIGENNLSAGVRKALQLVEEHGLG